MNLPFPTTDANAKFVPDNKRTQFSPTKADYQSGRSQETAGTDDVSLDSSPSSTGSMEVPSNSFQRQPIRSTPNSSVRSLHSESGRDLTQQRRPPLERKLSTRGRLTASNCLLSNAQEDMESVMTADSREAELKRQLKVQLTKLTAAKEVKLRPTLQRKMSSRGRLTTSNRQLAKTPDDMESVMTVDSAEAANTRQLTRSRRNLLKGDEAASTRCLIRPVQDSNNKKSSSSSNSSRSLDNFLSDCTSIVGGTSLK
jgi:hypothetical protein